MPAPSCPHDSMQSTVGGQVRMWKRNPRRPPQHRDVARVQSARRKAGELVAELVKDPDKQVRRAVDGFRQVVERGGLVGG
jgi:hypothetical protein